MWPLYIIFIILVGLQKRARIIGFVLGGKIECNHFGISTALEKSVVAFLE